MVGTGTATRFREGGTGERGAARIYSRPIIIKGDVTFRHVSYDDRLQLWGGVIYDSGQVLLYRSPHLFLLLSFLHFFDLFLNKKFLSRVFTFYGYYSP